MTPSVMLVLVILLITVFTEPLIGIAQVAAEGVLSPQPYIQTVLVKEAAP